MLVEIRLFAVARHLVGTPSIAIDLPERATVGILRRSLGEAAPGLAPLLPKLLIAVDSDYADDDHIIPPGAEVAVIPPVSGGSRG